MANEWWAQLSAIGRLQQRKGQAGNLAKQHLLPVQVRRPQAHRTPRCLIKKLNCINREANNRLSITLSSLQCNNMPNLARKGRIAEFAKAFADDTRGMILPYVTVMLVVIVGVSVLALDGARYMSLQTQLQNGADALALAGAAELDRLPDSETRATAAINRLISNATLFDTASNKNVRVSNIQFYSQLPGNDASPMSAGIIASDPVNARFVSVTVQPVTLQTILPASLFGGADRVTTGASAVGGFDQVVCKFPPIFVCNPFETRDMSYDQATAALQHSAADPAAQRRLIRMRQNGGATVQYGPGDYGFLDAPTLGTDANAIIDSIAQVHPSACFRQNGINIKGGLVTTAGEGFNVRFDLYTGNMTSNKNNSDYRPAKNVRKGFVGGGSGGAACNPRPANNWPIGNPPNQATGLPLDREWPDLEGRMGNGNWDFDTYWNVNHGAAGRDRPLINGETASNSNLPSRYSIYRYEIDYGLVNDFSFGGESGAPACYGGDALPSQPDRRIIYAAVINCLSLNLGIGNHSDVPVAAFGKFFMTIPLPQFQSDLFLETVGLVNPDDSVSKFDIVQLYR
jgi:Flp pilus assembly protein TadG